MAADCGTGAISARRRLWGTEACVRGLWLALAVGFAGRAGPGARSRKDLKRWPLANRQAEDPLVHGH